MKKKLIYGLLAFMLVAVPLSAIACEETVTPPAEEEDGVTPPAEEEEFEVIEITYATAASPQSALMMLHEEFCRKIEEASEGRIAINFLPGGALLKQTELREGVQTGVCQMALIPASELPGDAPLGAYIRLPLLGFESWAQAEAIYRTVFYSTPELQNEYSDDGLRPYAMRIMTPQEILSVEPIRVPNDLIGKKFFATQEAGELVEMAGGAPLFVAPGEWYTSLDTGLVEGFITHDAAASMFGLTPLIEYKTYMGTAGLMVQPQVIIINLDFWTSLPSDLQQVFLDLEQWLLEEIYNSDIADKESVMTQYSDAGTQVLELTPAEMSEWQALCSQLQEDWIAEMEAQGLPAQDIIDNAKQLIETESTDYHIVPSQ